MAGLGRRSALLTPPAGPDQELEECTFAPALCAHSDSLMAERDAAMRAAGVTAHATLYADAARRASRAAEFANWLPSEVTFAPVVHEGRVPGNATVVERLWAAGLRYDAAAAATAEVARGHDLTSGEALFVPSTGRAPARRAENPAYEVLYSLRGVAEEHRAARREAEEAELAAQHPGACARSARLAVLRRRRRFSHIFHALDVGQVGALAMLDAAELAAATLHPEIAADVMEAARLAGDTGRVEESAFCDLMEAALRSTHTGPRGYLTASVTTPSEESIHAPSFAPAVLERSRELAAKRRPAGLAIEDALTAEGKDAERRRAEAVEKYWAAELSSCTFAPELTVPPPRSLRTPTSAAHSEARLSSFGDLAMDLASILPGSLAPAGMDGEAAARVAARLA